MSAEPEKERAEFGALVRAWRERALLTQEQLAERAGLNVRTVRRLERASGAGRPQGASIRHLAEALGLAPAERAALVKAAKGEAQLDERNGPTGPPTGAMEVPRQLPASPPQFTGRAAELVELERVSQESSTPVVVIDGMAGVGKTALAVHAAHRMADRYPDGQVFLDLHGHTQGMPPVDPADALDRVLRSLGVPGVEIPRDLDDRAALYRSRLFGRRVLVLLDNVASETQVAPLLPGSSGSMVLVTSRYRLAGLGCLHTCSLEVLPPSEAMDLFGHTLGEGNGSAGSPELLAEIVGLCGLLPLAIRIAAARLRSRPSWTIEDLADRLRDHRHRLTELEAGKRGVTAALDLSVAQLVPGAQRAYHVLGLHPGADFDVEAAAALNGVTVTEARRQLDLLLDAHLLYEPVPGRYRFHDLTRAHASRTVGQEPEADHRALARLLDYYGRAASMVSDAAYPYERGRQAGTPSAGNEPDGGRDPVKAAAWLDLELPNLLAIAKYASEHGQIHCTLHLSVALQRHLRTRARYDDAASIHELALAGARRLVDRTAELVALNGLGHIRQFQGRYEQAADRFDDARRIALTIGDPDAELDALIGLGQVHLLQSRYAPATDRFREALDTALRTRHRVRELEALLGLGWVQLAQCRTAEEVFERAIEIGRAIAHPVGELHALAGLARCHRLNGRYADAMDGFQQVLLIARTIGSPIGELEALAGLGLVHRMHGDHERASEIYPRMLGIAREIGSRYFQFEALHGIGRLSYAKGNAEQAILHHFRALDIATDMAQPEEQARAHAGLGYACEALGNLWQARRHWREALSVLTALGADRTKDPEVTAETIQASLARIDEQAAISGDVSDVRSWEDVASH